MSTISPFSSASYYQMPGKSSAADTLPSAGTPSLAQILADNNSSNSSSGLDPLDLSPAAQSILNGTSSGGTGSNSLVTALSGSGGNSDNSLSSTNFVLTNNQQQQISAILQKYKDAPFTQATFDQIQNDLQTAGLSPTHLSVQDQVNSFNATTVFLDALSGQSNSATDPGTIAANEQTKSTNYINQIFQQWQGISTTANATVSGAAAS